MTLSAFFSVINFVFLCNYCKNY